MGPFEVTNVYDHGAVEIKYFSSHRRLNRGAMWEATQGMYFNVFNFYFLYLVLCLF
jgi:hypothetical protein